MKIYLIIENNNNTVVGAFESREDAEYSLPSVRESFAKDDITVEIEEIPLIKTGTKIEFSFE